MSRKIITIIGSIAIFLVAGAAAIAILLLVESHAEQGTATLQTQPKPGQAIPDSETPKYDTCAVLPSEKIKELLAITTPVTQNGSAGVVANNYENAETCSFTYQTADPSEGNGVRIKVFNYTPNADHHAAEALDPSWRNISTIPYPEYTLAFPAYYKLIQEPNDQKEYTLRVTTGARNYKFTITASQPARDEELVVKKLLLFAVNADYTTGISDETPPAPEVE